MKENQSPPYKRWELNILLDNSSLDKKHTQEILERDFYAQGPVYATYGKFAVLSLAIGLFVSGVILFFAYNWDLIPAWVQLSIPATLLTLSILGSMYAKFSPMLRKLLIFGASVLVGVLFAVFGQVYQTGANTYELFLVWSLSIVLFTLVCNFPIQWLLFLALCNTTLILYYSEAYSYSSEYVIFLALMILNSLFVIPWLMLKDSAKGVHVPFWFITVLEFCVVLVVFISGVYDIFNGFFKTEEFSISKSLFSFVVLGLFAAGYSYGYKFKHLFLVASIPFCLMVLLALFLVQYVFDFALNYIIIGMLVVLGSTLLIVHVNNLQKKWKHEVKY